MSSFVDNCGLTWKEMKITFNEYCRFHLPGTVAESVDAPDLKSVEDYPREGSSPLVLLGINS